MFETKSSSVPSTPPLSELYKATVWGWTDVRSMFLWDVWRPRPQPDTWWFTQLNTRKSYQLPALIVAVFWSSKTSKTTDSWIHTCLDLSLWKKKSIGTRQIQPQESKTHLYFGVLVKTWSHLFTSKLHPLLCCSLCFEVLCAPSLVSLWTQQAQGCDWRLKKDYMFVSDACRCPQWGR